MAQSVRCELCNALIPKGSHFVVRIDVFADPEMPEITTEELAEMDFDQTWKELFEQMENLTPEEAMDQVHRRFEFKLCPKCQRKFLVNPLGKPRGKEESAN